MVVSKFQAMVLFINQIFMATYLTESVYLFIKFNRAPILWKVILYGYLLIKFNNNFIYKNI